jgi:c-di-GMP phosphodiesterase Gmr
MHVFMVYQPIVMRASGALYGVECLVRGRNAQGQLLPAADVIAHFNDGAALDHAVLKAVTQAGLPCLPDGTRVSLNLGAIADANVQSHFCDFVAMCKAAKLSPVLELPEMHPVLINGQLQPWLTALQASGTEIALDDFGTGFAFLTPLEQLPINVVKLDKSLLRAAQSGRNKTLVGSVAQALVQDGYRVVAEGVETEADCQLLARWGVPLAQGYYYAKPMPASALTSWLSHGKAYTPVLA